jgi:hypothetical protein
VPALRRDGQKQKRAKPFLTLPAYRTMTSEGYLNLFIRFILLMMKSTVLSIHPCFGVLKLSLIKTDILFLPEFFVKRSAPRAAFLYVCFQIFGFRRHNALKVKARRGVFPHLLCRTR